MVSQLLEQTEKYKNFVTKIMTIAYIKVVISQLNYCFFLSILYKAVAGDRILLLAYSVHSFHSLGLS